MEKENDVLNSICGYLSWKKYFFWRNNNIPVYDFQSNSYRKMPKYSIKGVPDIIVILEGGYVIFLEAKTKTGVQSESQKLFQRECRRLNASYYLVRSIEDVQQIGL